MVGRQRGEMGSPMNVPDYEESIAKFSVDEVADLLSGDPATGFNVCIECCDRHAGGDRVALYWEGADGSSSVHTFSELRDDSARFANLLQAQGIGPGDRVAVMLPRIPELMVVALGVWRVGAVYAPMFTAFGPKAIQYRLERSAAKLIVTDTVNRPKLNDVTETPPVLLVDRASGAEATPGDLVFHDEMATHQPEFEPVLRGADDPFLLNGGAMNGGARL